MAVVRPLPVRERELGLVYFLHNLLHMSTIIMMNILESSTNYILRYENYRDTSSTSCCTFPEDMTFDDEDEDAYDDNDNDDYVDDLASLELLPLFQTEEYCDTYLISSDRTETILDDVIYEESDDYCILESPSIDETEMRHDYFTGSIPDSENVINDGLVTHSEEEKELIRAAADSLCQGNCLPLIKQELKTKIQLKRMRNGEKELVTDSGTNKEEKILMDARKREKTRELNRLSSLRSREKKSMQERQLQERVKRLSDSNNILQKELTALSEELTGLKDRIRNCVEGDTCIFLSLTNSQLL